MTAFRSQFMRGVVERGFMHQCTDADELDAVAADEPISAYIGFDCTAPSLHVGSLVSIMLLRRFQLSGHKPIVLVGGGTTKVGDPSGRDETRKLLDDQQIAANMSGIKQVFSNFLTFGDDPGDAIMVNNADWLDQLAYIPFLRDYGSHFSVNRMLSFDSVRLRLDREQPLSFIEFNYMVLQAYDFLELSRRENCVLQMGGSDQWGNIVSGVDLARRVDNRRLFGLTTPLLTTSSGAKMGKTASGAVWLSAKMVSPYDFWQYWRNTEDADVGRFLRLFTDLPLQQVAELEQLQGADLNAAKVILADEVTRLCHGAGAQAAAAETARKTFAQGSAGDELPTVDLPMRELEAGVPAFEAFHRAGLADTRSEARRLIKGGGGRVNNVVVATEMQPVTAADLDARGVIKLSAGKKRHALIRGV